MSLVLLQEGVSLSRCCSRERVSCVVAVERVFLSFCCSRECLSLVLLQQREYVFRVVALKSDSVCVWYSVVCLSLMLLTHSESY